MKTQIISFAVPSGAKWLVCAVLLAVAFFVAIGTASLRADLPVIGDWSDIVWKGGWSDLHQNVVFHPSSSLIAADGGWGLQILAVEDSGKEIRRYQGGHPVFSRSGKYLGYISEVGVGKFEIRVIDYEADTIKCKISRTNDDPFDISPDERTIVVGGSNNIALYDIETGKEIRRRDKIRPLSQTGAIVNTIFFLPRNNQIFFELERIPPRGNIWYEYCIWDLETDSIKPVNWRAPIAISYDGRYLAYAGKGNEDGRIATVIDLQTGEEVGFVPAPPGVEPNGIWSLALSADGKYLGCSVVIPGEPYGFRIWDLTLKKFVYVSALFYEAKFTFSPNGKHLAFAWSVWLLDFEKIKQKIEWTLSEANEVPKPFHATITYPNPTHDVVQVRFGLDAPLPTIIKVMDLTGRMVKEVENKLLEVGEYVYTIDLTDVAAGVYYLQIQAGNKMFNEKIVVSH